MSCHIIHGYTRAHTFSGWLWPLRGISASILLVLAFVLVCGFSCPPPWIVYPSVFLLACFLLPLLVDSAVQRRRYQVCLRMGRCKLYTHMYVRNCLIWDIMVFETRGSLNAPVTCRCHMPGSKWVGVSEHRLWGLFHAKAIGFVGC